nr:hypothetical protein [Tanacetum cinerariifolium]
MQRKKNDVKARTTLLLSLPEEHQLRFSKDKTARELWAAILKRFGGNEATKKTKKNLLKQQYGNFRAEGSETLEQTFSRLQVIVGQLQFMGVDVKQDDLNQKFLTSLAPEWLMHTIVWRNRSDLDTMSLDDLYNPLKVYESEVQKKSEPNTHNMAFISSAKHSRGNDEVNTASNNVSTSSANVATVSISQETACAYIASQSSGSQIKFEDINQIDEDDMEEMDIKWNMALLKDHALVTDEEPPIEFSLMANTSTESKVFDNSLCSKDCKKNNDSLNSKIIDLTDKLFDANNMIYHYKLALAQVESRLVEYKEREVKYIEKSRTLEYYNEGKKECIESLRKEQETLKQEKEVVDGKLAGLLSALKDLDNLIESQRSDKSKEGLGYTDVPHPVAQLYLSPKKDLSWTGLTECTDDTVTDYSRPSPTIEGSSEEDKNRNPSPSENVTSSITPKQFVKASPDFVMKKKAWFNCGDFNHLAYECRKGNFPPVNRKFSTGSRNFPTANKKFSTASRKFPTGSTKGPTADMGMKGKAVKPSSCWSWNPLQNLSNKGPKNNSVSVMFKKYTYIDTQGRLKFTWTFFLKTKDEISGILKKFITEIKNLKDLKVKIIRTPQQNGVAKRRNRSLIEAARTMLADAKLPYTFLAEAVNTVCYVQNRVLVNKAHNKTPYELFNDRTPAIGFLKPFGCHVMILITLDNLGKFEPKGDDGYFLGYSMSSKAFRVFNKRTKRVEENMHIEFLENKAIEKGSGSNWLFDTDSLTESMNYVPVMDAGTNSTNFSGTKVDARKDVFSLRYIVLPNWWKLKSHFYFNKSPADQVETLIVEPPIPIVSSPVPIICFIDSQEPSSETRLISKRVTNQAETLSLDNILTLTNQFEDTFGVTTNSEESNRVEADEAIWKHLS